MGKFVDHAGKRYGRLTALRYLRRDNRGNAIWLCRCDCGKEVEVFANNLVRGLTTSCGCFRSEKSGQRVTTHGHTKGGKPSSELISYRAMIQRCLDPRHSNYVYYGGRGIKVCDRWLGSDGPQNFFADLGPKPTPQHTLDRVDVNGNYEPLNCKWATKKEQANNKRTSPQVIAEHIRQSHKDCPCVLCATVREILLKETTRGKN